MDAFLEYSALSPENVPLASFFTADIEVKIASLNPKKRSGRKKFRETRHPVYRGIRMRDNGKWVCEMRQPNNKSRVWLGSHPTAEMAARAHDVAAFAFRGREACLNFADSVWRLPIPKSGTVQDIQRAAAEAAEAFRYPEEDVVEIVETKELWGIQFCVDEEDSFEMRGFYASMAEGLMVAPPHTVGYANYRDDVEFSAYEPLWSF